MKLERKNIVGAVIVTVVTIVCAVGLMKAGRHITLTGYDVDFYLRDKGSSFEVASLTKTQTEKVDAKIENTFVSETGVFVFQDAKGTQYVSIPKIHQSGWISQYFEGPISWGKYSIIEISYVNVSLSSANPLKVTVNYSARDRYLQIWVWLFGVVVFWLCGMFLAITA